MAEQSPVPDAPRAGGETPTPTIRELAARATYTIERLRTVSESVNAGHDRYIPNDADDAADLIAELRASLLERHRDGEWTCHAERNCGPHDAGCGKSIAAGEEYRCLDCDAVMHKDCLRAHCSADEKDATILRLQLTIQSRDDILERICAEMPDASAGPSPERA